MNRTFAEYCRDFTRTATRTYMTTFFSGFNSCITWSGLQTFAHNYNLTPSIANELADLRENYLLMGITKPPEGVQGEQEERK
jgi:hypothetical protein